jgi:Tfp pilus assembly protein PilN
MLNMNFVPDDYIQNKESCRTNILYSVLFLIVMASLAGVFVVIKARNERLIKEETAIDKQLEEKSQLFEQVKQLESKSNRLLDKAFTVSGLIEPLPRSFLLAMLTNNLPSGTSLFQVDIEQFEKGKKHSLSKNKSTGQQGEQIASKINLKGQAVSDLQVAMYIERLEASEILEQVRLVESVEIEKDENKRRAFMLEITVKKGVRIEEKDVKRIAKLKSV